MIQYYFSPTTKGIYCHEAHGYNMPNDVVPITDAIWEKKKQNPTWQMHYANGKLDVVHPDSLLSQHEIEERDKQLLVSQANVQIHRDEHLWNNQILWNRYTDEQKTILTNYYDDLIAVTRGESDILPTLTFKGL